MDGRMLKALWGLCLATALLPAQAREVSYIHTDALGSPVAETDANRNVVARFEYEPYGRRIGTGNDDKPGYTGHVMDAATGLVYAQQRYYWAEGGIFLSVDPVTAFSSPVGQFHRYRYAANNPYRFTDPDGRIIQSKWVDWTHDQEGPLIPGRGSCQLANACLGGGDRKERPYDENLKGVQDKYPQVTTEMADAAFDRFAVDNPLSSMSRGREWAWEMENGGLTPSREGAAGKVAWQPMIGVTQALGHTHGQGSNWYLRYFSADDVAAAKIVGVPVFLANPHGDFRVFVPGMRLNGKVSEGLLRGGAAAGALLCEDCVPTGE
jgi:RHS repeat-associated protein